MEKGSAQNKITTSDGDFQLPEEYVAVTGEGKGVRHLPEDKVHSEECQCALFELGSLCMTRNPDPSAIVHQLQRLEECETTLEEAKTLVLRSFSFQVAGSPEKGQNLTVKNWSRVLTQGVVQELLNVTAEEFNAAAEKGFAVRTECKKLISSKTNSAKKSAVNELVLSEVLEKLFSLEKSHEAARR